MDKFKHICAVAFDLDGTLVDSSLGLSQAVDMALYALELPMPGETLVEAWIGNGADVLMKRALEWALKDKAPELSQLMMAIKLFHQYYEQTCNSGSFLFPKVKETLGVLQQNGYPLGVVTNKPTPFVRPLLEDLGIEHYFQYIIGGNDVQNKKPHPESLIAMAELLQINTSELLFVGDSRNDIQAAKAAGCPSLGLTYGYNYGESLASSHPDSLVDHFDDLLPIIGLSYLKDQETENE